MWRVLLPHPIAWWSKILSKNDKALHFCTSIFSKLWNKTNFMFSIVLTCIFCLYLTRKKKLQIHLHNINRVPKIMAIKFCIYHRFMEMYQGRLINWVLQNVSTLIGQLGTVHICHWLTKIKQIYEPSCLLMHWSEQRF